MRLAVGELEDRADEPEALDPSALEHRVGLVRRHRYGSAAGSIVSTASDAAPVSAAVLTTTS